MDGSHRHTISAGVKERAASWRRRYFTPVDACYNMGNERIPPALIFFTPASRVLLRSTSPIYAEVFLKNANEKVTGNLTQWDSGMVVIHGGDKDRTVNWPEMTPTSALTLRQRLIDKSSAARLAGAGDDGLADGIEGRRQDRAWHGGADGSEAQAAGRRSSLKTSDPAHDRAREHALATARRLKYVKSTPEEDADAIATAKKVAASVSEAMKLNFTEVQTTALHRLHRLGSARVRFSENQSRRCLQRRLAAVQYPDERQCLRRQAAGVHVQEARRFHDNMRSNSMICRTHQNLLGYYASHGDGTGTWRCGSRDQTGPRPAGAKCRRTMGVHADARVHARVCRSLQVQPAHPAVAERGTGRGDRCRRSFLSQIAERHCPRDGRR